MATGGSGGLGLLFSNLEKFSGTNVDLVSWLRQFDRCCVVANKTDDAVKGQLLMLCVVGQAKAILENFEEENGAVQPFTELKAVLEKNYNTTAVKEGKMREFEVRSQNVGETEEEFMFELYNLYKRANPDQDPAVQVAAIKRKFLQGIDPEIRRNVFVFCNDPYLAAVTRDNLVEYTQKAKVYLSSSDSTYAHTSQSQSTNVPVKTEYDHMVSAMENLSTRLDRLETPTANDGDQHDSVASFSDGYRGGYRGSQSYRGGRGRGGRYNGGGRYNNGGRNGGRFNGGGRSNRGNRGGNRGGNDSRGNTDNDNGSSNNRYICYKCGGANHHARFCLSGN